ncbi:DUF4133 domain-containing protein [Chitinophaga pendula]|uniref:DUF4133 domain-containing protein n=1 Tax=Chitinophaga TaxID=79328 RepID=UPI000BAF146D|nr:MULTISPECIES: DUF4133 domain-containing protein [Chitinophaga]ASZ13723.1 hypothetical protein CK934_23585 [Chitinophaga sp. MD30]UCJ08659.1 DUF4133 domain-containing protein [Chitinophaga pendula]
MANSVYKINKGVNNAIEFKGLKAQYIWYLGGGLVIALLLFAILYLVGVNSYLCIILIGALTFFLFMKVYKLSNKYGEHGMMKKIASRGIPKVVKCNDRHIFKGYTGSN